MKHMTLLLSLIAVCLCQTGAMGAFCPAGKVDEIFCDDFETYCGAEEGGGYPYGGTLCTEMDKPNGRWFLYGVWMPWSGGTTMEVEDGVEGTTDLVIDGVVSGRYGSKGDLGQEAFRDWLLSPEDVWSEENVHDMHRLIGNVFGTQYAAVAGSDDSPLIMQFDFAAAGGKLHFSAGYYELAFGDHADPMNRANTDYAMWPKGPCCNGMVQGGPWPLFCALGNPYDNSVMGGAGCPSIIDNPPPVRQALAVGAMPFLDTDPCHCGDNAHKPTNIHLNLFDGQVWWMLRNNSPFPTTGEVIPIGSAPLPAPSDVLPPGEFILTAPPGNRNRDRFNRVVLTIRETTMKVEMFSVIHSDMAGAWYVVKSEMDNIPRAYTGPFDRTRVGVGPGCVLASNSSWETCNSAAGRQPIWLDGFYVDFDNFVLSGGRGYSVEGACCNATDGSCDMTLEEDCAGRWTKSGQPCSQTICCPQIYGDIDANGSVDMDDFAVLQRCITTGGGTIDPSCRCFDYNADNAIGSSDVQRFADCANGPGVPGDSSGACAGRGW